MKVILIALLLLTALVRPASAHAMRSGYVELIEGTSSVAVRLRASVRATGFAVEAPEGCRFNQHGDVLAVPTESLAIHDELSCDRPLAGRELRVRGIGSGLAEIVVLHDAGGVQTTKLLREQADRFRFQDQSTSSFFQYVGLGVAHIAAGIDHLLFLLLLTLSLRRLKAILLAETAFTLSHTVSFTLTGTGLVHVPAAPTEILIALSIVLMALDCPRRFREPTSPTSEVLLAFVFGIVHGLGFAGGLREIGLPEHDILRALLGFATGVEIGQVAFVLVLVALGALAMRWRTVIAPRVRAFAMEGVVLLAGGYATLLIVTRTMAALR